MIHRNTYVNGPTVLRETWQVRTRPTLFFAGQMSGVEGYVESAASGLIAGRNAAALARGEPPSAPPRTTAIGALAYYVSHADPDALQPIEHHVRHHAAARREPGGRKAEEAGAQRGALASVRSPTCRRGCAPRMNEHLKAFLEHLALNENASAHTVRAYESDLTQFLDLHWRRTPDAASRARRRPTSIAWRVRALPRRAAQARASRGVRGAQARGDPDVPAATCGARASSTTIPAALVGDAEARAADPAHLAERRDDDAARDARHRRRRSAAATARSSSCSTRPACA